MKGGGAIYPNKGVKIDPRPLTSIRMPESLKVYTGYLNEGFKNLLVEGILTRSDMEREFYKIQGLLPLQKTKTSFTLPTGSVPKLTLLSFFERVHITIRFML